ncbi:hypothetical protein [Aeromonas salmonicida]
MYKTLSNIDVSNESYAKIIHFVIGVLIKYKYLGSSDFSIDLISTAPKGQDLEIAHNFLSEINASNLVGNDEVLNMHIQNLYESLKSRMEISLKTDNKNGEVLLNRLRGK